MRFGRTKDPRGELSIIDARARMTAPTTCERTASARLSLASLDRPNDLLATAAANSFDPTVKAVLMRAVAAMSVVSLRIYTCIVAVTSAPLVSPHS